MAGLHVREAQESDLPEILKIYAQPGLDDDGSGLTVEEARARYQRFRCYPSYRLFVAVQDGQVAGTFALLIMDNLAHHGAPSAVVEDVAVRPDMQGRGVGRRMMEFARERCREAGCYKMALSSNLKRAGAHAFYDSLGFERHGYSFRIRP
jgi:GNAT superfamily N-acetyltransferase